MADRQPEDGGERNGELAYVGAIPHTPNTPMYWVHQDAVSGINFPWLDATYYNIHSFPWLDAA